MKASQEHQAAIIGLRIHRFLINRHNTAGCAWRQPFVTDMTMCTYMHCRWNSVQLCPRQGLSAARHETISEIGIAHIQPSGSYNSLKSEGANKSLAASHRMDSCRHSGPTKVDTRSEAGGCGR